MMIVSVVMWSGLLQLLWPDKLWHQPSLYTVYTAREEEEKEPSYRSPAKNWDRYQAVWDYWTQHRVLLTKTKQYRDRFLLKLLNIKSISSKYWGSVCVMKEADETISVLQALINVFLWNCPGSTTIRLGYVVVS